MAENRCVSPSSIDAVIGSTVTRSTTGGGSTTVTLTGSEVTSSTIAAIFAMPAAIAVISPVESTVATSLSSLDHAKVTPPTMVPSEVLAVAMSWCVSPDSSVNGIASTISTLATSGAISSTVTVAGVLVTSLPVAVIIAVPAATAVTSPVLSTVATPVSSLAQVNVTSATVMPSAVNAIAVNRNVPPTIIIIEAGLTTTRSTTGGGSTTVTLTGSEVTSSTLAVIIAVPAATAVTSPVLSTVATPVSSLAQVNVTSATAMPSEVDAIAVNRNVPPTTNVIEDGLNATLATTGAGGGVSLTVIVAGALVMPFPAALIVVVPALTAVATPPELMVATAVLLLDQVKSTPLITAPSEALAVATNLCVLPTSRETVAGLTSI